MASLRVGEQHNDERSRVEYVEGDLESFKMSKVDSEEGEGQGAEIGLGGEMSIEPEQPMCLSTPKNIYNLFMECN